MRKTTNYKRFAAGGGIAHDTEVNILATPKPASPKPDFTEQPTHPYHEMTNPPHQLLQEADASNALQKQIDAQRHAEDMQRKQIRAHQFLNDHPDMRKHHSTLNDAENDAVAAGHRPDSDQYYAHVEKAFLDRRMAAVATPPGNIATAKLTPDTLSPAALSVSHDPHEFEVSHNARSLVSAPVSREVASTGYGGNSGHKITLSQAHKEHAKVAGISEVEYAKQLLRLRREKAEGGHGGQP